MLKAIQYAHYVHGWRVVDPSVLYDLAKQIEIEVAAFSAKLDTMATDQHIAASRRLMQRAGLSGFPGFLLERDGPMARLDHERFYGRPAEFVRAIARETS